ncbi:hypothetical protein Q5752_003513 [Cryptotrichosporon argae]
MPRSSSPFRERKDMDASDGDDTPRASTSRHGREDGERKASSSRRDRDDRDRDRDHDRDRCDREREWDQTRRGDRDEDRSRERRERRRDGDKEHERDRRRRRSERDDERDERRRQSRSRERRRDKARDSRSPSPGARARRKEAKEARAAARAARKRSAELEQARALAEVTMYSASSNPFHDANLGEQFVWHKKREKERRAGLTAEEIARKDAARRREAKEELERLNKRRADREAEMALRAEEEQKMRRLAEDAAMAEWHAREGDFELEQARRRAGIRLRMQRAKAIDFLAINLRFADATALGRTTAAIGALTSSRKAEVEREEEEEGWGWADAGFEFEIDEPWRIFDNLTLDDCVELKEDIAMYLSLEKSPINIEFWEAMHVVCQYHLDRLQDPAERERAGGRGRYSQTVEADAGRIVAGLSVAKLVELERNTHAMLSSGQPVDGEFWDVVLRKITVQKAIAKLDSIHEVVLKNRLEQFKKRQREDAARVQAEMAGAGAGEVAAVAAGGGGAGAGGADEADEDDWVEDYASEMSVELVERDRLGVEERWLPVVDEAAALRGLFASRRTITEASYVPKSVPAAPAPAMPAVPASDLETERLYRAAAALEAAELEQGEEEQEFGANDADDDLDADLDAQIGRAAPKAYDWSDKYRPRKPRFFNRVKTGYEWTAYNQTHYDTENPPPKIVQGYKFNIFYPDLIDKTRAPTYYFRRIPDDNETVIIVFTAGPPYEDIAFRIVRFPWEYSHRRGFRSNFDRGVLQLYFNFARQYYKK